MRLSYFKKLNMQNLLSIFGKFKKEAKFKRTLGHFLVKQLPHLAVGFLRAFK
jgi:hypothetical protein